MSNKHLQTSVIFSQRIQGLLQAPGCLLFAFQTAVGETAQESLICRGF